MYKDEGINLSNEWLDNLCQLDPQRYEIDVDENEDHVIFKNKRDTEQISDQNEENAAQNEMTASSDYVDSDDEWDEIEEQSSGTTDTLLQPSDPNDFADQLLTFAPGEGNQPYFMIQIQNIYHFQQFTVGKHDATIKIELFQYIIVIFVNGNSDLKTVELLSQYQTSYITWKNYRLITDYKIRQQPKKM